MFTSFLSGGVVGPAATTNGPLPGRMFELPTDTPAGPGIGFRIDSMFIQGRDCMGTATHVSQGPFAPLPSVNSCPTPLTATHSLQRLSSSCASCTAAADAAQSLQQCQAAAVQAALQLQAAEQVQAASQLVPPEQRTVFFAGVPPMVTEQQLLLVFSNFDAVEQINLFKPFNNSRTSKGCGLAVFATRAGAAAAIAALHASFRWPNTRAPMVVEWKDPRKAHRKVRTHLLMALQPGQLLYVGMPAAPLLPEAPAQQPAAAAAAPHHPPDAAWGPHAEALGLVAQWKRQRVVPSTLKTSSEGGT